MSPLSKAFQKAVDFHKPVPNLTHQQVVMRMYRSALRTINSWAEDRDIFNEEALKIRAEFDEHKNHDPGESDLY